MSAVFKLGGEGLTKARVDGAVPFERDGLVRREGARLLVSEQARPLLRTVCALFDQHLADAGAPRHAQAV